MKTQLAAAVVMALCIQLPVFAQNPPPIAVMKLGKLQPGDQLSIAFHRDSDREGGMMNLTLFVSSFEMARSGSHFLIRSPQPD
jgi:hypothetical protein